MVYHVCQGALRAGSSLAAHQEGSQGMGLPMGAAEKDLLAGLVLPPQPGAEQQRVHQIQAPPWGEEQDRDGNISGQTLRWTCRWGQGCGELQTSTAVASLSQGLMALEAVVRS